MHANNTHVGNMRTFNTYLTFQKSQPLLPPKKILNNQLLFVRFVFLLLLIFIILSMQKQYFLRVKRGDFFLRFKRFVDYIFIF